MGIAYGKGWGSGQTGNPLRQFLEVTGITDATQKQAVTDLYNSLRSAGLWDKMEAIYPIVGGTPSSHRWNLKNVLKHTIEWNGGTHTAQGVVLNANSHNLNLHMSDFANISTSFCASLYVRNGIRNPAVDWGSYPDTQPERLGAHIRITDNNTYYDHGSSEEQGRLSGIINHTKLISFNRLGTSQSIFRDGEKVLTATKTNTIGFSLPLYLNSQPASNTRQFAFISFGQGLTDTEAATLNTIVNTYQTSLGRAV